MQDGRRVCDERVYYKCGATGWAPRLAAAAGWTLHSGWVGLETMLGSQVGSLSALPGQGGPEALLNSWAGLPAWFVAPVGCTMSFQAAKRLWPCFPEGRDRRLCSAVGRDGEIAEMWDALGIGFSPVDWDPTQAGLQPRSMAGRGHQLSSPDGQSCWLVSGWGTAACRNTVLQDVSTGCYKPCPLVCLSLVPSGRALWVPPVISMRQDPVGFPRSVPQH